MECVLTRSAELFLNLLVKVSQYLTKYLLLHTILVIHLEMNLSEKFNLNLRYILIKALDADN